jgi:hypothetical protein
MTHSVRLGPCCRRSVAESCRSVTAPSSLSTAHWLASADVSEDKKCRR